MSNRAFAEHQQKAVIIDDELDICLLLGMALRQFGIAAKRAHTLHDGLNEAANEQPHVIFLDNNLPDGQGIDYINTFRQRVPKAKIVMITAMGSLRDRALTEGADDFIEKPLDLKKIAEVVSQA